MAMILEVQHETRFYYDGPVTEWVTETRMEPASDADQTCHSFHLKIAPAAPLFRFQDGFANRVHHFNLTSFTGPVHILAAAIVETHPKPRDLDLSRSIYPVDLDSAEPDVLDFLRLQGPVRPIPRLTPLLEALKPAPGMRVLDLLSQINSYIHANFEYARDVTLASSPIDHLLDHQKGVCQDFTHLMIALLRSFELPARYVSGYIHRPNKESQSHAWCEAWLPDLGWVGIDPTNNCFVNDHFVKVATGRDFTDVPPNRGVYRGRAAESIFVRVETRRLERLPSMSWQDQLPPLDVPLTAIISRRHGDTRLYEESDQQQ